MIISNKKFLKKKFVNRTFSETTFKNCNFWESSFKNVKFYKVKIIDCIFCDAIFKNVTFNHCIIKGSNFSHSKFFNTKIKKSKLSNINYRDSIKDNHSKIPNYISTAKGARQFDDTYAYMPKKNKNIIKFNKLEKKILHALIKGPGFYVVQNYFTKKKIKKAFNVVDKEISKDKKIKKNLSKFARDKIFNQKYVYNILNKDKVFSELIQPKIAMRIFEKLLGQDFICGFFGANCLLPGARGQSPHLDYPYVSFLKPGDKVPWADSNYVINCQILIPLTEFSSSNGSTSILKNSHKLNAFPYKDSHKKYKFMQVKINPGSIVIFNGLMWHYANPNYSDDKKRFCTLANYLPKYILPQLDIKNSTKKSIYKNDKGILRKLLGIDLPFPSLRT